MTFLMMIKNSARTYFSHAVIEDNSLIRTTHSVPFLVTARGQMLYTWLAWSFRWSGRSQGWELWWLLAFALTSKICLGFILKCANPAKWAKMRKSLSKCAKTFNFLFCKMNQLKLSYPDKKLLYCLFPELNKSKNFKNGWMYTCDQDITWYPAFQYWYLLLEQNL